MVRRTHERRNGVADGRVAPPEALSPSSFPVVALGASAGGLEALKRLIAHLPAEPAMAVVVIQHLDPIRPSMLARVLEAGTRLPVVETASGMRLESGRVYVIPAGADLTVEGGVLRLTPRRKTGGLHLPIDTFFRSLAEDVHGRAIGVVLSGSGTDGTAGLRAIKADGGIAMAQDPASAQFRSMPDSAIAAGVVDFQGSPEDIAGELARLSRHPYVAGDGPDDEPAEAEPGQKKMLALIFAALRRHASMDFSGYKETTLVRRIQRRMAVQRIEALDEYAALLAADAGEALALAQDMLIHVTAFFRDREAFEALTTKVLRELVQRKGSVGPIRIWVPGCATGEEAYSIAIALMECLDGRGGDVAIKIFGTDLSAEAIEKARAGIYSEAAVADVSPERLSRFFERVAAGYQIGRVVRDVCVFVKHDLTSDPPFAKLDLISCRNVLIYFDAELQRRVIPMLHYCLIPHGHLFLGQSETITGFRDLFSAVDRAHRIFVKTGDSLRLAYPLPAGREAEVKLAERRPPERRQRAQEAQRQADHLLLAHYAPPGVIVNDRLEIVQFRGRTGAFLEPAPGQPQANVLRMARGGLAAHLHEAVEQAKAEAVVVRKPGLRVEDDAEAPLVDLVVLPLAAAPESSESYFLIVFETTAGQAPRTKRPNARTPEAERPFEGMTGELERVKAELVATKDYLQSLIAENQTSTDDLAATNEELVAANEELQSANEELQSAKEELQSTNEELTTVNDQLRHRNLELDQIANDLVNVLSSVEIPLIIVDLQQRVRRFTPAVSKIASLIPEDVGRPIDDLKLRVRVDDLGARIKEVVDGLSPKEWEVQGNDGCWFRMQIRPYRTADNRLDGAVLSFVDVHALRRAIEDAEGARDYATSIVETVTAALVVLDSAGRVVSANSAFYDTFELTPTGVEGRRLAELSGGLWEDPGLLHALDEAVSLKKEFAAIELATELPRLGRRVFSLSGRPILWGGDTHLILLAIEDVTELRSLESERIQLLESEKLARLDAERATRAKDIFLATLSHELRTPLSAMLMSAQLLKRIAAGDARIERPSASIERAATAQAKLIDDLLDVSRIVSGKLMLDLGPVDFAAVVQEAVDLARPGAQAKAVALDLAIDETNAIVYGDSVRLQQVVNNLLNNAIKFTPRGGRVSVCLARIDHRVELVVADTGMGIPVNVLPQLFGRFVQADSTVTRVHGGLGLGLSIVRHLVEAHGGEVSAESPGEGRGATFRVILPTGPAAAMVTGAPQALVHGVGGVRVLLVDDDEDTREAYAAMLTELGAEVRAEPSAAAGLAAVRAFRPQVILSDIAMPGEDGLSFIRKVRGLEPSQGGLAPAAALTALASDDDRRRALEAGFQLHVAKPIEALRLATIVRWLADQGASERALEDPR